MVTEQYSPYIETLLQTEPWRSRPGPSKVFCQGAIDWDGSAYWCCQECGRVGTSTVQMHHPARSLLKVILDFMLRR